MKKLLLVLGVVGATLYFTIKGAYSLCWRLFLLLSLISPVVVGVWLAYAINVLSWKIETLWVMPPLIVLSLAVGQREFSWTEPLLHRK